MPRREDPHQQTLFGDSPEAHREAAPSTARGKSSRAPECVAIDEPTAALARAIPASIRLGTSSWSFPGWRGIVWDRDTTEASLARHGLRAYGAHPLLRTVGIDKTYYRPAPREEFERLRSQVPDGFSFLVKAHEAITHREPMSANAQGASLWLDPKYATDQVIQPAVDGLGASAGPILFQFSPMGIHAAPSAEGFIREVGAFLAALPQGPLYAVEVRDRALLRPSWGAMLADTGAVHCYSVHPKQGGPLMQAKIADPNVQRAIVCRWMLHSGLSYNQAVDRYQPFDRIVDPDPTSRDGFARLCEMAAQAHKHSFVIINNKAEGSAPRSVRLLAETIAALVLGHPPRRNRHA